MSYSINELAEWIAALPTAEARESIDVRMNEARQRCSEENAQLAEDMEDPDFQPDYGEFQRDCDVEAVLAVVPNGRERMPLCDLLFVAVVDYNAQGVTVRWRRGPLEPDYCYHDAREFGVLEVEGLHELGVIFDYEHSEIGLTEVGIEPVRRLRALRVLWSDHDFRLPLGSESLGYGSQEAVSARHEIEDQGRLLRVQRVSFMAVPACDRELDGWPLGGEDCEMGEPETELLRWDPQQWRWVSQSSTR